MDTSYFSSSLESNVNILDDYFLSENDLNRFAIKKHGWGNPRVSNPGGGVLASISNRKNSAFQDHASHGEYLSARRNTILMTNYKSLEPRVQNYTNRPYNSDGLSPPHHNPSSMIAKSDEYTWAISPVEWTGEHSLTSPPMSPMLKSCKNDSDELESFISLLKWGKYLLTPSKPKLYDIKAVISPTFRMYPPTTQDIAPERSFSLAYNTTIDNHSLPFDEPGQWFSPTQVFDEDYFIDEQKTEDRLNAFGFAANACAQKFPSEEINHWNRRVLFPVLD